jgi:hypothetical protein
VDVQEEHTDRDAAVKTLNGKLADLQLKTTVDYNCNFSYLLPNFYLI